MEFEKASETKRENEIINSAFEIESKAYETIRLHKEVKHIDIVKEKRLIWKSLIFLFIVTTLGVSASITLINSITSLHPNGNFGITILAVAGGSQLVSSAFFVSTNIKLWGCLNILRISSVLNFLFVIAFFYANWITLIIGAICLGFGISLLYAAGFMYVNSAGYWLSQVTDTSNSLDAILVRVSGLMNASIGAGFVWGNLALYLALGPSLAIDANSSQEFCGAAYCNQELNLTTLDPPSPDRYYTLIGILTVFSISCCATTYFLEDFSTKLGQVRCTKKHLFNVFVNSWRTFKNPNGYLLFPLSFAVGIEQSFMLGDFTKAIIGCSLGISMVGLVMMSFGVTAAVISISHWIIIKKFGRPFGIGSATVIFSIAIVTMLTWKTNPQQLFVYFILVCLWAAADSVSVSVLFSTYAALFEENMEEAFAAASFVSSMGILFWFVCSPYFCMDVKLYFILIMFIISFVLYLILEKYIIERKKSRITFKSDLVTEMSQTVSENFSVSK